MHEVPGHVQADKPENRGNQPASPACCTNTAYLTSTTSMLPRSAANFISWGEIIFTCRAPHARVRNASGALAASLPPKPEHVQDMFCCCRCSQTRQGCFAAGVGAQHKQMLHVCTPRCSTKGCCGTPTPESWRLCLITSHPEGLVGLWPPTFKPEGPCLSLPEKDTTLVRLAS